MTFTIDPVPMVSENPINPKTKFLNNGFDEINIIKSYID